MDAQKLKLAAEGVEATPFEIPGAVGGPFRIQILNEDSDRGVVTSIVHLPPGSRIPAHRHQAGSEMHYLLEGDLIDAGEGLRPGAFLTHAAGVVHGPHESRGGAKVLTVQGWQSRGGSYDFEPAEEGAGGGQGGGDAPRRSDDAPQAAAGQEPPSGGATKEADRSTAQDDARINEERTEAKGYS